MSDNIFDPGKDRVQQDEIQPEVFEASLSEGLAGRPICRLFYLWSGIRRHLFKVALALSLMILPLTGYGQWLQVSPTSMPLWGQSPKVAKLSLGYRSVEVVYLYGFKTLHDSQDAAFGGEYFGLFWNPLAVERGRIRAAGGVGYFFQRYPTANGTHINFSVKLSYRIDERVSLQYGHISNGFGLLNSLNPGVDNIGLAIVF